MTFKVLYLRDRMHKPGYHIIHAIYSFIIKTIGGELNVVSRVDDGSAFVIHLPLNQAQ